jgi:hypothetical protein
MVSNHVKTDFIVREMAITSKKLSTPRRAAHQKNGGVSPAVLIA